jgi:general secretion pathway protein G
MRKFREMIFSGGNKGFTLIELLVVIAVLGILAGIAVPRMTGITDEASVAAVEADLRNARTGVEMYFVTQNSYPNSFDDITSYVSIDISNYPTTSTITSGDDYTITLENDKVTGVATSGGVNITKK